MELDINEININRYANGELNGDALKEFEVLLQKDKTLQEKVKSHEFMDAVLFKNLGGDNHIEDEKIKLKPILNKLGDKFFIDESNESTTEKLNQTPSNSSNTRRLLTFATLAAAAAFLLFLFIPDQESKLYTQFFEPPAIDIQLSKPTNPSTIDNANKAYQTKNYKKAITLYEQAIKEDANNSLALQYKGGAELVLDREDAALKTFQQFADKHPRYADLANWYLALCYLKKGNETQTKTILKRISSEDKEYYNKAQQLLKDLNGFQ